MPAMNTKSIENKQAYFYFNLTFKSIPSVV